MKRLKQFNLSQLNRLFEGNDPAFNDGDSPENQEQLMSDYLAKHLLVARNPPISRLMTRLSGDTFVMPEMRVMILKQGSANPMVNLTEHHFEAGQMIFLSQNSIVQPQDYTDDLSGFGLSLTDEIVSLAFPSGLPKLMDGHVRDCHFMLTNEEMQQMEVLHTLLYNTMHSERIAPQVVLSLTAAFLWQADCLWNRRRYELGGVGVIVDDSSAALGHRLGLHLRKRGRRLCDRDSRRRIGNNRFRHGNRGLDRDSLDRRICLNRRVCDYLLRHNGIRIGIGIKGHRVVAPCVGGHKSSYTQSDTA